MDNPPRTTMQWRQEFANRNKAVATEPPGAGLVCVMEIVLGLVVVLAGVVWASFLLYRHFSMRNLHKLIEHGDVHIRITMRGTEVAVWREAVVQQTDVRPIRRVS
jgi:hypothetical protein